ncbi:hypothetical protein BOX37_14600 [Nocardia mangyaensis]|uniref:AB hydrolase-1 domain-containing protein n=1 Tax=Nocardia mangyaensis TaxID=2213200 RepID=A0A1J0VSG2_9NOCA|nr:alpha/beta fold hydrolase [Nocardia mangyaensis]APE34974.1 hypothetical protein BOX37_14600 [Nocardia mangyaensis]
MVRVGGTAGDQEGSWAMPTFDFRGTAIAYDEAGSGEPIVFLHNLGGDRRIWGAQVAALRGTHQVFALDLIGYGESDAPDNGYTLENYVAMVEAFLAARDLREVTLVGHCFGSALALLHTRRHPGRARSLILSSPLTPATLRPTRTGWAAVLGRNVRLDALLARVRLPGPVAGVIVSEQLGAARGTDIDEVVAHLRTRWTEPRRLMVTAAISREIPRLAELDDFAPPTDFPPITTVWGARNRVLSARAGAVLNRTLRPVRDIVVDDAGHLVMVEAPDVVTDAVRTAIRDARSIDS